MKNRLLFLWLVFTITWAASTQAGEDVGSIRGYVRDASNGETLPNANVIVDSTTVGTTTDKGGYFVISRLSPGPYSITFSYIGYESRSIKVEIQPGKTASYNVELTPVALEFDEIETVGKRVSPTDITPVGSFGTRVTELARIPTVGQPDLLRGVQLLPGVQASSDNSAGLYVRGGTPGQNLILLDDVVVYNPSHLFGFFSTFNPDALKNVLLLKGAFPARYGDRLSSVLDITNLDGNRKSFSTRTSVDLISAGLTAEGPLGSGSWMISGRRTYQELINSPLFSHIVDSMFSTRTGTLASATPAGGPGFGLAGLGGGTGGGGRGRFGRTRFNFGQTTGNFDQGYNFYDTNFKINLDPSPSNKLSLSGYLGQDQLDLTLPSFRNTQRSQLLDWGNQVASLRWMHVYTDRLLGNVQFSASRYASNFSVNTTRDDQGVQDGGAGGPRGFGLDRDNRILDLTFKADLDYYASSSHTVRFGAQVTRYDASYRQGFSDSIRSGVNTVSRYETGYLEYTLNAGGLEFTPGLRLSHFQLGDYADLSPRVSARYRVNENLALKGGWGIYHQYINLISVEGFSYTTDMWLPVDETLTPGRAVHNAAGITFRPGEGWETDIEFYHKDLSNLVEFQSQVRLSPGASLSDLFLQGTGRAYGGELLLRKTAGRTTGWIGYTLGYTRQTFPELNDGKEFPPKYDRRHDASLVLNHTLGRGWNLNFNWVYATGQAYTIPDSRYTVTQPSGQTISYIHVSEKNAYRLPAYHRMDLGITKDFLIGEKTAVQLVLSVFNLYNRRNIWYRTFDATEEIVEFQDVLLQPVLPSIGLKFIM